MDKAFASVIHDAYVGAKAVAHFEQKKIQPLAPEVEGLSALIPVYGPEIELIERLAFSCLGSIAALVNKHGSAEKASAAAPELDVNVLTGVAAFLQLNPSLVTKAASLL